MCKAVLCVQKQLPQFSQHHLMEDLQACSTHLPGEMDQKVNEQILPIRPPYFTGGTHRTHYLVIPGKELGRSI